VLKKLRAKLRRRPPDVRDAAENQRIRRVAERERQMIQARITEETWPDSPGSAG